MLAPDRMVAVKSCCLRLPAHLVFTQFMDAFCTPPQQSRRQSRAQQHGISRLCNGAQQMREIARLFGIEDTVATDGDAVDLNPGERLSNIIRLEAISHQNSNITRCQRSLAEQCSLLPAKIQQLRNLAGATISDMLSRPFFGDRLAMFILFIERYGPGNHRLDFSPIDRQGVVVSLAS